MKVLEWIATAYIALMWLMMAIIMLPFAAIETLFRLGKRKDDYFDF